ncbi:hypothetical protein BDV98DRAFT_633154 [Pterulicium gracile]|uniref:Uncharacterized protein n=1 Tax=Pterulicium gracile TaxID=1884261 RepID=A0A5C3Q5U1_9AGAR|nr:hypothetical protein BDV98DRAFT_633154 [Pterula gracilis]
MLLWNAFSDLTPVHPLIRYYSIALLIFDVTQIHTCARPGITNDNLCVAMAPVTRIVGAISLWSAEIIMQLRIYALYGWSKKVAAINAVAFLGSIAGFFLILTYNAIHLPFFWAVYKAIESAAQLKQDTRRSMFSLFLFDNLTYFFGPHDVRSDEDSVVQLQSRQALPTVIDYLCRPFHATIGVLMIRMLFNVRKAAAKNGMITVTES